MKFPKVVLILLMIMVTIIISSGLYFKNSLTPSYEGSLKIPGLNDQVEVYFTQYGVPHIYAQSESDAYRAMGYIHAQDRLWQMDLLRRVGSGRLAEIFGEELIEADKYLRTIGLGDYAKTSAMELKASNSPVLELTEAYIEGINVFIEEGPGTLEHLLLGIDPEPFTLENVFEVIGYMSFSFANAQKTDPLLNDLYQSLDSIYLKDLPIFSGSTEVTIPVTEKRTLGLSTLTREVLSTLPAPYFIGSNSWVLAPSKTGTGNAILVNDPHIAFAQPAVWYETHIASPVSEYYGYFLAGNPFPPIMHNEHAATGLTMFENDDMDFYLEEINPEDANQYRYKGTWVNFERKTETIEVKGGDPVTFEKRITKHGPIVSDILDDPLDEPVSMYWVYTHFPNSSLQATYDLTRAKTTETAAQAAATIHGPGLNVMYANGQGEIAWWASGKLIYRENEQDSKTFRAGNSGTADPDSTLSFELNPQSVNPAAGYVYSANNQPAPVKGISYSGYYLPDDRAERITALLNNAENLGVEDMKKMLLDEKSMLFSVVKPVLLANAEIEDATFKRLLEAWDGSFTAESVAATIFQRWTFESIRLAMSDEMDSIQWATFLDTHLFKRSIEKILLNDSSIWWDKQQTAEIENRRAIIQEAFEVSYEDLVANLGSDYYSWQWKNAHTLTHNHAMGVNPFLAKFLNVGPFQVSATNEVLNNLGFKWSSSLVHETTFGPSTRRIIDMEDPVNKAWSILPTGQSGNVFSPYFKDQAEMYVRGEFRKMIMNQEEITSTGRLLKLTAN